MVKPVEQDWSFAGPFGTYDKGQLQRGLKIYKEVCSACHSMKLVSFRSSGGFWLFGRAGQSLCRRIRGAGRPQRRWRNVHAQGGLSDKFPSPYANDAAAAAANNGAAPPDFSLIAKARGAGRGLPLVIFDVFTQYAEGGPDYIYSLLTGYDQTPPAGMEIAEGTNYNPHFMSGKALAMAKPLSDDQVTYDDGTPQTVDQYARDVSAFLMWASEPHLEARKQTGFKVMIFLLDSGGAGLCDQAPGLG